MLLECAFVRSTAILIVLLASVAASADTIHLKNGRNIFADSVKEKNGKIEYSVGDDTYAISKSSVERIDTGGSPVSSSGAAQRPEKLQAPTVQEELPAAGEVFDKVIHDGDVDREQIAGIEKLGRPE